MVTLLSMVVTKLKITRRGDRVSVYLDDKYAFSVERNLVVDLFISQGTKLSKKDVKDIKAKDFEVRYYHKVLDLLSRRPRSEHEIRLYLERKLFGEDSSQSYIKNIIKRLKSNGFIDDLEFAKWWVENRVSFKPRGKYLIKQELRVKGVEKDLIEEALESSNLDHQKEYKLAQELGLKKKRILKNLSDIRNKRKFLSFLMRKGFSYDIAKKVLRKLD
ncbi:RecX family transcriptional regulator [Candidatus Dojkabacteria bacterium]|nr:RecX family transcriptional regulator [Candidatus Dojkabacteria bacterium]